MANLEKSLGKNPTLISTNDLNSLSSTNIVGIDKFKQIFETTNFSFSSRLVNYIDSEIFKGIEKTVFYTEVNTEFDKGDKVFILNGNYDSNSYIETNKYDYGSDGYEVLEIDNCRVILDIDYKGDLPYDIIDENDVLNIYPITNTSDLEQATSTTYSGVRKFDQNSNNIIYYTGDLNYVISDIFDSGATYSGPTFSGPTFSGPTEIGFHVIIGNSWFSLNSAFNTGIGSFGSKFIKIKESNIEHVGVLYKEDFVYKYNNGWVVDNKYIRPIISRSNFRGGKMLGSWNSGVYGKSDDILSWSEPTASWGGGILYNSKWELGEINSLDTNIESYLCQLDSNGEPLEEIISNNNKGFGYNYIISSEIKSGTINNGNIINTNIDSNLTDNVVKDYLENTLSTTASNVVEINGGFFFNSNIDDSIMSGSEMNSSKIKNSLVKNSKSINSYFDYSVFKDSVYITDDIIKILGVSTIPSSIYVVGYKFEVSKRSFDRFKIGDYFYLKGIRINNTSNPLNFFHMKYKLSTFIERFEYVNGTTLSYTDLKITSYTSEVGGKYYVNILFENKGVMFPNVNNINIDNAYILDSNFESGLFETSDWNSGFNIGKKINSISNINGDGKYNLTISSNQLKINNPNVEKKVGEVVFLNSVDHVDNVLKSTRLSDTYFVDVTNRLEPLPNSGLLSTLGTTNFFNTGKGLNRNGYLHKLKFVDSKIKGGVFRRTYFNKCLIENKSYKSSDKDLKDIGNIRSLLISESIFSITNNFLSSATYLNCLIHRKEDVFIDGIIYNSIWDGGIFNKGVFRDSTWIGGEFNGGEFYKNRSFDANPNLTGGITDDRIASVYKSGSFPNDRHSWRGGEFNGGLFNKSDWETGNFNDGKFIESKYYDGIIKGGTIGDTKIDYRKTRVYKGTIENTKVENAHLYAGDPIKNGLNSSTITWNNGVFEKGVFGSKDIILESCFTEAITNVSKAINKYYVYISSNSNVMRLDLSSVGGELNLSRSYSTDDVIKTISDSLGNPIIITKSNSVGQFGRVIKFNKTSNVDIMMLGINQWIIEADQYIQDIHIDSLDNIYVCYTTKICKYDFNKKLIWSVSNNISNSSISGDDTYIYVTGGDVGGGYLERWKIDGTFVNREDIPSFKDNTKGKRIRVTDNYLYVSGYDPYVNLYSLVKYNKSNIVREITATYSSFIDFVSYDDKVAIIDDSNIYFYSDTNLNSSLSLHPIGMSGSTIEYSNDSIYFKKYGPTNSFIEQLDNALVTQSIYDLNYTTTDITKQYKFDVKSLGIGYSKKELYSPTYSNGVQSMVTNTFEISNVVDVTMEIPNVDFEVGKLSFYHSGYYTTSSLTPSIIPLSDLYFEVIENNVVIGSQSIILDEVFNPNNGLYSLVSDWLYYEFPLNNISLDVDYKLKFYINNNYEVKVDQFCVYSKTGNMVSVWNDGKFNGGEFVDSAKWNNGKFNGGKFLAYNDVMDPINKNDFNWLYGEFNGGEFGNKSSINNSTWYNGKFNGGSFNGKLWNNGIFTNGKFNGGVDIDVTNGGGSSYMSTFTYSTSKGIWRDGYVTSKVDRFITDQKLYTDLNKVGKINQLVLMENVMWLGGTFSHESGTMDNSIWKNGVFESGTFNNSVFNPWVNNQFNTNDITCKWTGGVFKGGDFYYSKWMGGLFNTGNAYGMIWEGGISNYMNAYNILWKKGTWKNGNWFGSDFDYIGSTTPSDIFRTTIMDRINSEYGISEYYVWNLFNSDFVITTNVKSSLSASNDII